MVFNLNQVVNQAVNQAAYFSHCHSERSEESSFLVPYYSGFFATLRMTEEELTP